MQEKVQQWVDAVRNGHLHHRNVWFLLGVQFWPWVGYSLCNSMAAYEELENALQKQYFQILLVGSIIRTAPLNCRMVDAGFCCPGLPHPGVKALIAMSNKLLIHFGCRTALGTFLRTAYSFLLLEIGISFQPLQSLYQQFSFLAMHTWMKMLWEKLDKFGIIVQTADTSFQFPQGGDKFLMLVFMEQSHSRDTLKWLNQVQIHLQIIFLSDILLVLGLRINPMVFQHQKSGVNHSTKKWPREEPMELDFAFWQEAVEDIRPSRLRVHSIGKYVTETHRIHPWQWRPDSNTLLHSSASSATTDEYSNTTTKLNRYTKTAACLACTSDNFTPTCAWWHLSLSVQKDAERSSDPSQNPHWQPTRTEGSFLD
jgi:hypothetical protein